MIIYLRYHPTTKRFNPGYYVLSERRRRNMGGPYSLAGAKKRLRQVEAWKHMRGRR